MQGPTSLLTTGLRVAGGAVSLTAEIVRTSLKVAGDVAGAVLPGRGEAPPAAPPPAGAEPGTTGGAAEAAARRTPRAAPRTETKRSTERKRRSGGTQRTRKTTRATPRARAAEEAKEAKPAADGPHTAEAAPSPAEMREFGRDVAEDDVELAATTADSGAEEGAGPEVTIEAPWDDYDALTAEEVERRLDESTPLVAAAVRIYEREHGGRSAVLRAAERRIGSGVS